jgi:hypothetical protein
MVMNFYLNSKLAFLSLAHSKPEALFDPENLNPKKAARLTSSVRIDEGMSKNTNNNSNNGGRAKTERD